MVKPTDLLTKRVRDALSPRGAPAEFCRTTGISRSQVQLWFKEPVNPTVETLAKIASALSTTPAALLDPGSPAVPAHLEDIVKILSHAPPPVLDAVRALLAGYAKGVELDPPPNSRASLPEHREDLPEKRKHRGK